MATYIYLPIATQEMKDFANKLNLGSENILSNFFLSGKGKAIARFFGGCLCGVKPWDTLLVICHGATGGSKFTGADRNGELKKYDPKGLVRAIVKEGLTKSFIDLKLLICGGGLARNTGVTDPFAERVCNELKAAEFSKIRVTGYLGDVSTDGGKITILRHGVDGSKYYDGNIPGSYKVYT